MKPAEFQQAAYACGFNAKEDGAFLKTAMNAYNTCEERLLLRSDERNLFKYALNGLIEEPLKTKEERGDAVDRLMNVLNNDNFKNVRLCFLALERVVKRQNEVMGLNIPAPVSPKLAAKEKSKQNADLPEAPDESLMSKTAQYGKVSPVKMALEKEAEKLKAQEELKNQKFEKKNKELEEGRKKYEEEGLSTTFLIKREIDFLAKSYGCYVNKDGSDDGRLYFLQRWLKKDPDRSDDNAPKDYRNYFYEYREKVEAIGKIPSENRSTWQEKSYQALLELQAAEEKEAFRDSFGERMADKG